MKLVPNWKDWWKMWSIRLNILFGFILIAIAQFPETFIQLWVLLPQEFKDQIMTIEGISTVFVAALILSSVARLIKQFKSEKDDNKDIGEGE